MIKLEQTETEIVVVLAELSVTVVVLPVGTTVSVT